MHQLWLKAPRPARLDAVLSIVSVPIGNLGDITLRAIETLKSCDAIVCEDTRVTGKLLSLLELPKKDLISAHSYANPSVIEKILERLKNDEHIVLVSDAGTPGISDPGYVVVSRASELNLPIQVIPGASAFLAALSASGLPIHNFLYLGFLPLKKGRQTLLSTFIDEERTIVFYESVHRIQSTLSALSTLLKDQPKRNIVIARELTKAHEEVIRTTIGNLDDVANNMTTKGEFVIVLGPKTED